MQQQPSDTGIQGNQYITRWYKQRCWKHSFNVSDSCFRSKSQKKRNSDKLVTYTDVSWTTNKDLHSCEIANHLPPNSRSWDTAAKLHLKLQQQACHIKTVEKHHLLWFRAQQALECFDWKLYTHMESSNQVLNKWQIPRTALQCNHRTVNGTMLLDPPPSLPCSSIGHSICAQMSRQKNQQMILL